MAHHTLPEGAPETISTAAAILEEGGIVVFKSDTTYGIACDVTNAEALQRIQTLKQRADTRYTVIAGDMEQVREHLPLSPAAITAAEHLWPAPVSVIAGPQFSVRIPAAPTTVGVEIAQALGKPIVATSANISGQQPPATVPEIQHMLGADAVDLWVDGGACEESIPSTVVHVHDDMTVDIVREGQVTREQVEASVDHARTQHNQPTQ